jgi:NadR type nicotinamide-nucleotide adenylyltransferase
MEKHLQQQKSNCIKIVLFGPESTGKSSLAKFLASHYKTYYVDEFARQYLQEKWDNYGKVCEKQDLIPIAVGQIKNENILSKKAKRILFCDTDLLTTAVYSRLYFDGFCDAKLDKFSKHNYYDLYLLMDIDIEWVKDDLRDRPNEREELFNVFKDALIENNKNYMIVSGNFEKRKKTSIEFVDNFLNLKNSN